MKPFTVDWNNEVTEILAGIWLDAPDRRAVTKAQAEIDRLLERNPLGVGGAEHEGLRRLHVPPLEVLYSVDGDRRVVDIADVGFRP